MIISKCKEMIHDNSDGNTLVQQLSKLSFNDTVYRTFNEGLRLDRENEKRPKLIIDQFHRYFFKDQAISIRRILDKGKDVYSLRRVFDIVYENSSIFTRRGYISANQKQVNELKDPRVKEVQIEHLNQQYDIISNVSLKNRNEDDHLYAPYLRSMDTYINKRKVLHEYTNAYIAHSYSKKKRGKSRENLNKINLNKMQEAYKYISWLSYMVSRYIGVLILFEVPSVPYYQFEGWVGSIYKRNIERSLNTYWCKRVKLFDSWKQKYWFSDKIYITPYKSANT